MNIFRRILTALLCCMLLLVGCIASSKQKDATPRPESNLKKTLLDMDQIKNRTWVLKHMTVDGQRIPLVKGSQITFRYQDDGHVSGNATINHYRGRLMVEKSTTIQWPKTTFMVTRKAGPPRMMKQEAAFLAALEKTGRMTGTPDMLVLTSQDSRVKLEFEP